MMHDVARAARDQRLDADVVVVGSGAGGAVAAHRLQRAGKSVVLVEEGPAIDPRRYHAESWEAMKQLYYDQGMRAMVGNLIIPTMQGRVVGGTTVVNSAICFRLPDEVLERWVEEEGLRDLSPDVLRPIFDEVEEFLNISPEEDRYQGRHNLLMRDACAATGWRGHAIRRNSRGCHGCGRCILGCPEGAKLSMDRTYVPAFLDLGGELLTGVRVEQVMVSRGRAVGVRGRAIDPVTMRRGRRVEVRAKAVVLACGTVGTPAVLAESGLGGGMVGRNLVNHVATGMLGFFDQEVRAWDGVNQGYCCDHFRKDGFIVEVFWAPLDLMTIRVPGFGMAHKQRMARMGHVAGWGAMIRATSKGRVWARPGKAPAIFYWMNKRDGALMQRAMKATADLLFAGGAKMVTPGIHGVPTELTDPGQTRLIAEANLGSQAFNPIGNHPMGTCRMSERKGRGVVDSHGESHQVERLFVADASVFPDAPGVNPQVSIMALAAHCADYVATVV
jgi:choline dehydrogenase-like flavoprotein